MLLRQGERLVGGEAHQEAAEVYCDDGGLAPQQHPSRHRLHGLQGPRLLHLYQGEKQPNFLPVLWLGTFHTFLNENFSSPKCIYDTVHIFCSSVLAVKEFWDLSLIQIYRSYSKCSEYLWLYPSKSPRADIRNQDACNRTAELQVFQCSVAYKSPQN